MGIRWPSASNRTVRVAGPGMPEILGRLALVFSRLSDNEGICSLFEYEIELKTPRKAYNFHGPEGNFDLRKNERVRADSTHRTPAWMVALALVRARARSAASWIVPDTCGQKGGTSSTD